MLAKDLCLIYGSLSVGFGLVGVFAPFAFCLAVAFAACSLAIAIKQVKEKEELQKVVEQLQQENKQIHAEIAKMVDVMQTVANRVNMSVGVRK